MKWSVLLQRKYNNFKFQILKRSALWVGSKGKTSKLGKFYLYAVIFLLSHLTKVIVFLFCVLAMFLYRAFM